MTLVSQPQGGMGVGRRRGADSERPIASNVGETRTRDPGTLGLKTNPGKWCPAGQHWLPLEAFAPNERLNSGLDSWCRRCHADRTREWREANPEYLAEYNAKRRAEYRDEHPRSSRPCVVCGEPHNRRPDALVCSERCRNRRKAEQQKQRAKAA